MSDHWHQDDFEQLTANDIAAYCAVSPEYIGELDVFGYTPLLVACLKGYLDIARVLVSAGADVNFVAGDGETPLKAAISGRKEPFNKELFDLLLRSGAKLNTGLIPPLHIAVGSGNRELVKYLIEKGADPNLRDVDDDTPIFWTGVHGGGYPDIKMMQLLIKLGADLAQFDGVGQRIQDRLEPAVMAEALKPYHD